MRTCGRCRLALRWDETLQTQLIGGGFYQACPRCVCAAEGLPAPRARKYPPGEVPRHPLRPDADLPVCGLCREALHEGERVRAVRLAGEDIARLEGEGEVAPGAYHVCQRCWDQWAPVVIARWERDHVIVPGARPETLL